MQLQTAGRGNSTRSSYFRDLYGYAVQKKDGILKRVRGLEQGSFFLRQPVLPPLIPHWPAFSPFPRAELLLHHFVYYFPGLHRNANL